MEDIIHVELLDLGEYLRSMRGQEVETNQLFNFYVMNSLWSMMCGSRLDFGSKTRNECTKTCLGCSKDSIYRVVVLDSLVFGQRTGKNQ